MEIIRGSMKKTFLVIGVCLALAGVTIAATAGKTNANEQYDWLNKQAGATLLQSKAVTIDGDAAEPTCNYKNRYTKRSKNQPAELMQLCITEGNSFRRGVSKAGIQYLSIGSDSTFYYAHYSGTKFLPVPGTDKLAVVWVQAHYAVGKLHVYNKFSDLIRFDNTSLEDFFKINAEATPAYPWNNEFIGVSGIGFSANGKYLAYSWNGPVFLLDLESLDNRLIGAEGYDYRYSPLPSSQYAVSNDGAYVAQAHAGIKIWSSALSTCAATDPPGNKERCLATVYDWDSFGVPEPNPLAKNYVHNLAFSTDGSELGFTYIYNDGSAQAVRLGAPGYTPVNSIEYLALGDSFSSGEGDTGKPAGGGTYYVAGTNVDGSPTEKCHISERSYPYKLANSMGYNPARTGGQMEWASLACSGAVIHDASGAGAEAYLGQGNRLQGYDAAWLKAEALNETIPGRQKQIEFVKKYKPKVITMTMGGNDAQFGATIKACVLPVSRGGEWAKTCSYAKDDEKKAHLAYGIMEQRTRLVALYEELLHASGPNTKLYVLGYPVFVDDTPSATCDMNVRLNAEERRMVAESTRLMNRVVELAAEEAGAIYVNIEDSLGDYVLCGDSKPQAANGITGFTNNSESYHPNDLGHSFMARRVWEATGGVALNEYDCRDSQYVTCPGGDWRNLAVSQYFVAAMQATSRPVGVSNLTADILLAPWKLTYNVIDYTFGMNSPVSILLYSEPTSLGAVIANENGGLQGSVQLPGTLAPGYHTIELQGNSPLGEPITLWKIIEVRSADVNDYDGDGIANNVDECLYIEPAGVDSDGDGVDDGCDAVITEPVQPPAKQPTLGQKGAANTAIKQNTESATVTLGESLVINQAYPANTTLAYGNLQSEPVVQAPSQQVGLPAKSSPTDAASNMAENKKSETNNTLIAIIIVFVLVFVAAILLMHRHKINKI